MRTRKNDWHTEGMRKDRRDEAWSFFTGKYWDFNGELAFRKPW